MSVERELEQLLHDRFEITPADFVARGVPRPRWPALQQPLAATAMPRRPALSLPLAHPDLAIRIDTAARRLGYLTL